MTIRVTLVTETDDEYIDVSTLNRLEVLAAAVAAGDEEEKAEG